MMCCIGVNNSILCFVDSVSGDDRASVFSEPARFGGSSLMCPANVRQNELRKRLASVRDATFESYTSSSVSNVSSCSRLSAENTLGNPVDTNLRRSNDVAQKCKHYTCFLLETTLLLLYQKKYFGFRDMEDIPAFLRLRDNKSFLQHCLCCFYNVQGVNFFELKLPYNYVMRIFFSNLLRIILSPLPPHVAYFLKQF